MNLSRSAGQPRQDEKETGLVKRIVRAHERVDPQKAQSKLQHRSFKLSFSHDPAGWSDVGYWVRRQSVRPALFVGSAAAFLLLVASVAIFAAGGYGAYTYGYNYSYVAGSFAAPPATMAPGQRANIHFTLKNTSSSQSWCGPTCNSPFLIRSSTNSSSPPGPSGVSSPLYTPGDWISPETPTQLEGPVGTGGSATFNFVITAPSTPGTYQLFISPRITNKGFMDTIPVTIRITVPGPPSVSLQGVPGTIQNVITLSAAASSGLGLRGVQFKVDGANINGEDTSSPFATSWNSHTVSNGRHTITATATDTAGRSSTASQTVTVSNAAPGGGGGGGSGGGGAGGSSGGGSHGSGGSSGGTVSAPPQDVTNAISDVVPEVGTPQTDQENQAVVGPTKVQGKSGCNYALATLSGGLFGDLVCTIKHAL